MHKHAQTFSFGICTNFVSKNRFLLFAALHLHSFPAFYVLSPSIFRLNALIFVFSQLCRWMDFSFVNYFWAAIAGPINGNEKENFVKNQRIRLDFLVKFPKNRILLKIFPFWNLNLYVYKITMSGWNIYYLKNEMFCQSIF